MRFLVDAQLPPSLAATLREAGHDAGHVFERFSPGASDEVIWQAALRGGQAIVTKDEDFAGWSRLRRPAPPVLWLRMGNLRKADLRARLVPLLPGIVRRFESGEGLVEVY